MENAFEDGKLDVDWDCLINHIDVLLKLIKVRWLASFLLETGNINFPNSISVFRIIPKNGHSQSRLPSQSESINKVKDFLSETKDFVVRIIPS